MIRSLRFSAAVLLTLAACASGPKVQSDLLPKQTSWAVLTIFAKPTIKLPEGLPTPAKMATSDGVEQYLQATVADHEDKLKSLFKDALKPLDTVTKHPGYKDLPQKFLQKGYVGVAGFRSLHMEEPKAMGEFAKAVGVDALIMIRHELEMEESPVKVELDMSHMNFSAYRATDRVTMVIISNKGETLLDSTVTASGVNPKVENKAIKLAEGVSPIPESIMKAAVTDAVVAGLDAALRDLRRNLK